MKFKEFRPTSWAIDNSTSIYVLVVMLAIFGYMNYRSIPKEQFPDIVIPTFVVNTVYPGTSPVDIENLVTRYVEKKIRAEKDISEVRSQSMQDISSVIVEFRTGVDVAVAKQRVKDAVDKARPDLPADLPNEPEVIEISFSEFPILYVNLSGDQDLVTLKKYAEEAEDRIESLPEINRVDIVGALDREIQVNVDMFKMRAAGLTFSDIEMALSAENLTVAGGNMKMDGMARSLRVVGEFKDMETIRNLMIGSTTGALVALRDVADVADWYAEQDNFSRLNGKNVVTLNIIKKSGSNLLDASDKIKAIMDDLKTSRYPKDLAVVFTGDQSYYTRSILNELNNTIILGFILVSLVLMFFMGMTNAIFVGLAVPLSMAIAYMVLPMIGFTMNMLVMFSFIFALGIVVDDAIVVVENTHRIFHKANGALSIATAAKMAAGEIFVPILSGTLTTLAPFVPLCFWPGVVGQFMIFIPVTVIITLTASLIVAYIINPVFAVSFMTAREDADSRGEGYARKMFRRAALILVASIPFYLTGTFMMANLLALLALIFVLYNLWGYRWIHSFQVHFLPWLLDHYERLLRYVLVGSRPYYTLWGTFVLLIATFVITGIAQPKVLFFPDSDPTTIMVYLKMPEGTDVEITDTITKYFEKQVVSVLGENNPDVESIVANVALGASESSFDGGIKVLNKSKISINFVEYAKRVGPSTSSYMNPLREALRGVPGASITVAKDEGGPPTGEPVNIEIAGEEIPEMVETAKRLTTFLIDSLGIEGIENLKMDFEETKPEIVIELDREKANYQGITAGQVGMEFRSAIYGKEVSQFRDGEDQYPIMVRYRKEQREDLDALMETSITYRAMSSGVVHQVPISSVASVKYQNSYGSIQRLDEKRVITLSSKVLDGYNANEINASIRAALPSFDIPQGISIEITGEQEDQAETTAFMGNAMIITIFMILFILITQFNSLSKPLIILSEIIFSLIGVLLGFIIFGKPISIIMTGMGVVALAGIVIRNGILLVEFTEVLKSQGYKTRDAIVMAGKTRITPVLLTAIATILGLIPLAIGMNIDFASLLTSFNPHLHFGGENMMFFGPLAWAIIYGLSFATFLTLILIPVMYFVVHSFFLRFHRTVGHTTRSL